jgi:hypothetical protein
MSYYNDVADDLIEAMNREPVIPCSLCAQPTAMIGTGLCDRCWELKRRIEADPELAKKILQTVP